MPIPTGYGELTRSVIIANSTDPELALDNHRSYFPGGPFFPAPITRVGNVSLEIPKLVGIDHQAPKRTRSSPNSQRLENMQEGLAIFEQNFG
ncbi:hypothetical protein PIB30_050558 [Stylosanthes scabra]|uniref:Uncharacterized protein n=1 Tax=Stylosanthes scabra TaxID=79078 RepID=A0ABU6QH70_9FABA|nr:hypothetical protein [Stylosanthes scabra]